MKSTARIAMVIGLLVPVAAYAAPGNLVLQVPDWNQPGSYGVAGYPSWCSPTAGGNLMGYWEDVKGATGLTDRAVFNATPLYPATGLTYQQGLWHDGMIEMGWHMDTAGWQSSQGGGFPLPFPPAAGSTMLNMIGIGMLFYATTGWVDDSYGPNPGTGIVKVAYANTTIGIDTVKNAAMWTSYTAEVDASRPALVSFAHWVDTDDQNMTTDTIDGFPGQTIEKRPWNNTTEEHTVVGVGYIDVTPGFQNNGLDEWFVCQDGWGTTGQYVAVPLDTMWLQNDYVTDVPEPATMALLAIGAVALIRRRTR